VLRLLKDHYAECSKIRAQTAKRGARTFHGNDNQRALRRDISTRRIANQETNNPTCSEEDRILSILSACMCVGEILSTCLFQDVRPHYARQRLRTRGAFGYAHARITIDRSSIRDSRGTNIGLLRRENNTALMRLQNSRSFLVSADAKPKERVNTSYRIFVHLRDRCGCRQRERPFSISMLSSGPRLRWIRQKYRFSYGAAYNVSLNSARCYLFETETAACKSERKVSSKLFDRLYANSCPLLQW